MKDVEVHDLAARLYKSELKYRSLKAERAAIREMLKDELDRRETDTLALGRYTVRRTSYDRKQFDVKAFADAHPKYFDQYAHDVTVARLEVISA